MNEKDGWEQIERDAGCRGRSRGQSLVEFAFSLVILLILVAGIFDGARALFTYLSMRDAAQEGALFASIEPGDDGNICQRACGGSNLVNDLCDTSNYCHSSNIDISVTYSGDTCMGNDGSGNPNSVRVTIDYPAFQLTMPFIGAAIGSSDNTVPISASVMDTIIAPPCE